MRIFRGGEAHLGVRRGLEEDADALRAPFEGGEVEGGPPVSGAGRGNASVRLCRATAPDAHRVAQPYARTPRRSA
eukprot:2644425-Pyramimonas_sp.AAC.1